jgi:hypothetical protein
VNANQFIKKLSELGWQFIKTESSHNSAYNNVMKRITSSVATDFLDLISQYEILSNKEDNIWFLSVKDYLKKNDGEGFAWNEFELQSLESAEESQRDNILQFWKIHLPFLMGVKNGYAYAAIVLEGPDKGAIVTGNEPEYEETTKIAANLEGFFDTYISMLTKEIDTPALRMLL